MIVAIAALPGERAHAQTVAGEVVEARLALPLRAFPVRLMRLVGEDSSHQCDSTLTDERGLFQLGGSGAGRYQLRFGFSGSRIDTQVTIDSLVRDSTIARRYAIPVLELGGAEAFSPRDVQEVAHARVVLPLRFPKELASYGLPGDVLVRFVVSASGHADPATIVVLRSNHPAFTRTVTDALRTMVFEPARIGGIAVPQVVEQPFTFTIDDRK